MWLPEPIYRRVPVIYTTTAAGILAIGVHSFFAWASAALFLSSAILICYLRAIQPERLRELAEVPVGEARATKAGRPRAAGCTSASDAEQEDVDAEISRWAETGFANVAVEQTAARG